MAEDYLYGLPIVSNGAYAIDLGYDPILNVTIDEGNELNISSRKAVTEMHGILYTLYKPVLPLEIPNNSITNSTNDFVTSNFHEHYDLKISTKMSLHYKEFKLNQERKLQKTLKSCLKKNQLQNYNSFYEKVARSQEIKYRKFVSKKKRSDRFNSIMKINDILGDIPKALLEEHLDESLFQDYDNYQYNFNHCNTVASFIYNNRIFIICRYGPCLSELVVKEVITNWKHGDSSQPLLCKTVLQHSVDFCIKEVTKMDNFDVFIRGDYHCAVYALVLDTDPISMQTICEWSFDEYLQCACINPFCLQELVLSTEQRQVTVLNGVSDQQLVSDDLFAEKVDWQRCIYGNTLQTCLCSTENDVLLYDFRIETNTQAVKYLELPCQYLNRVEKLSPVLLWSPWNQNQCMVTSDQSFILLDERYLKTPVFKLNHYMDSSPRYINTHNLGCENTLLTLGCYSNQEIVCYQMCHILKDKSTQMSQAVKKNVKVSVREPPWKLTPLKDLEMCHSDWKISLSVVKDRLNQPLSGYTVVSLTESKDEKQCAVISQSLSGDLFYQFFSYSLSDKQNNRHNSSCFVKSKYLTQPDVKPLQLSEPYSSNYEIWLNALLDNEQSLYTAKNIYCKLGQSSSADRSLAEIREHIVQKSEIKGGNSSSHDLDSRELKSDVSDRKDTHSFKESLKSSLRYVSIGSIKDQLARYKSDDGVTNDKTDLKCENLDQNNSQEVIETDCTQMINDENPKNSEIGSFTKLKFIRTNNLILCNNSLKRKCKLKTLNLFENKTDFRGPISKVLSENWSSDDYNFLDTFAPNVAFDPSLNTN